MTRLKSRAFAIAAICTGGVLLVLIAVWLRCSAGPAPVRATRPERFPARTQATVDEAPVQVRVTKLVRDQGHVIYRYEVVNGSAFPVSGLSIGEAYYLDETELDRAPLGWRGDSIPQTPASSVESPPGWTFEFTLSEDGPGTADWKATGPSETLLGGSSLAGFAVVLAEQNAHYEEGHWTVYLNTNEEILYSGSLQPTGVASAPTSSVFGKSDLKIKPNPSNSLVGIQFAVLVPGVTSVDVYDAQGRLVRRVLKRHLGAGGASITWDGRDEAGRKVAGGVYFIRVKTPTTQRFARVTWLQ